MRTTEFTPMFFIFKKGTTESPIKILKKINDTFNEELKREKYINLGYTITEINQKL